MDNMNSRNPGRNEAQPPRARRTPNVRGVGAPGYDGRHFVNGMPQKGRPPQRRQGPNRAKMETRPLPAYPGFTPEDNYGSAAAVEDKPKSKALPIILSLILIVGIIVAAYYLLFNNKHDQVAAMELRNSTNRFRMEGFAVQNAVKKASNALASLQNLFTGTDEIKFAKKNDGGTSFVDNAKDNDFYEPQSNLNIGRMVFPSISVNGPMASDATEVTLLYGYGLVDFMPKPNEEGMSVVLGHRYLSKLTSFLYFNEVKQGDPFYIDYYSEGKRYYYTTQLVDTVKEEEYLYRFKPDGPDFMEADRSTMLVVCDPAIYGAEEQRILVYGEFQKEGDIPEDDVHYQRYKQEHGLS